MSTFDLETYLSEAVENVVKSIVKTSLFCPAELSFMAKYAAASRTAAKRRKKLSEEGTHIPPYLIASITSACNLHCAGCYARSLGSCADEEPVQQLTGEEWGRIFREAVELGIGFVLLAGGEPLVRADVLRQAAERPEILFPIFTNGTLIGETYMELFDRHRNLVPILSIEGGEQETDRRRGDGTYRLVEGVMAEMKKKSIAFGASITVTTENVRRVTAEDFVNDLIRKGCRAVFFVEYVPVSEETASLAPTDAERAYLDERLLSLRKKHDDTLFVSFPGDEKGTDGCLAAGRGFFHINSHGGAEPCPFSPYSDCNVLDTGLLEALRSKLFTALREGDLMKEEHRGGCVLFERKAQVEALLARK